MNTIISGRKGEDLAAESYQKQGFTILKRNYRFGRAEVDIIAQKGDTLAIVEVKWRSNTYFGDPQSFVSKKQQRSLITAANHYVNSNGLDVYVRFDIVSIVENNPKSTFKLSKCLLSFSLIVLFVTNCLIIYYFRDGFTYTYENNFFGC